MPDALQGLVRPLPAGTCLSSARVQTALWPGSTTMVRPASGLALVDGLGLAEAVGDDLVGEVVGVALTDAVGLGLGAGVTTCGREGVPGDGGVAAGAVVQPHNNPTSAKVMICRRTQSG